MKFGRRFFSINLPSYTHTHLMLFVRSIALPQFEDDREGWLKSGERDVDHESQSIQHETSSLVNSASVGQESPTVCVCACVCACVCVCWNCTLHATMGRTGLRSSEYIM